MLDVVGPAEVFTDANKLCGDGSAYEVEIISAAEGRSVPTQIGVPILAQRTYRELRGPVDTLLVGGGEWPPDKRHSPDFLTWLRAESTKVRRLGSVCTGALVLADAGLLNGRPATTHWHWCNELIQKHPSVKVAADSIYIRDKNIYTSAGVTAGIDLALALVEEDLGSSVALQVARMMMVFLRRPGGAAWGITHGMYAMGVPSPRAYLAAAQDYNLRNGIAEAISCPTLICEAEGDIFFKGQPQELFDHLTCRKTFMRFTESEGAGAHCQVGAGRLALAWL